MSDRQPERGIPDGLLMAVIGLLLGMTLLVWGTTGLAALFTHGGWPEAVTLTRTPMALRHLVTQPRNLPAAWPDTPAESLSGYGLFWGLLIGELLALIVLGVFVVGTVARWKAVRARRRAAAGSLAGAASGSGSGSDASYEAPDASYEARGTAGGTAAGARTTDARTAGNAETAFASADRHPPAGRQGPAGRAVETSPATDRAVETNPATDRPAPGSGDRTGAPDAGPRSPQPGSTDGRTAHTAGRPDGTPAVGSGTEPGGPAGALPVPGPHTPAPQGAIGTAGTGSSSGPAAPGVRYGADRGDTAVRAVLEAAGPVLVTTSDAALWAATKDARAKLGPVHVFDPSHLLDTPDRLRWSPLGGCTARETAAARAAALLAPVRPHSALDSATADVAETLLRCWLHAAAVDGRPFRQVLRWAQGSAAHEPVRILRTHVKAAGGAAGELESALTGHPERREVAQELTARALGALSSVHVRDACNPHRADSLAWESFVAEGGTLYVVGEAIEDPRTRPGAMPLLTALVASVVERGRGMAGRSSAGRLDPPLSLVLDDVAAVAPVPALPDLLADGAALGLPTFALMRSEEQARARWPHRTLAG
ncbi:type VI secretion protein [Streptosporangium nondiastaticum]|uniref:Type VI secretion protein n=1 Tax=Streptosporangium nondiastaticum TaxID=35764 RepID=A0A9X7JJH8_9ACTN|nr:type VI secretion protein [Streptosporangium nondiastaticum]PSJ24830.1 type VI secretion protein [Streptosporangium nondiastaticum]